MVYLSYYSKYPIYEAAEGGYYYEGIELVEAQPMSLRKAKKIQAEWLADAEGMEGWKTRKEYKPGTYCYDELPGLVFYHNGEYIGEGAFWVIERKKGSFVKGWQPYC